MCHSSYQGISGKCQISLFTSNNTIGRVVHRAPSSSILLSFDVTSLKMSITNVNKRLKISNSACGLVGYFRLDWISGDIWPPLAGYLIMIMCNVCVFLLLLFLLKKFNHLNPLTQHLPSLNPPKKERGNSVSLFHVSNIQTKKPARRHILRQMTSSDQFRVMASVIPVVESNVFSVT